LKELMKRTRGAYEAEHHDLVDARTVWVKRGARLALFSPPAWR